MGMRHAQTAALGGIPSAAPSHLRLRSRRGPRLILERLRRALHWSMEVAPQDACASAARCWVDSPQPR
eukprot:1458959-Pleurochrysis_carterae.AAC.2